VIKEEVFDRPLVPTSSGALGSSQRAMAFGGVKTEASSSSATALSFPTRVKSELELKREEDAALRRQEAHVRDMACKAICAIKHGLRKLDQIGMGRQFIPEDWDAEFAPVLGDYLQFLMTRPDQFRLTEYEPGFFEIENITGNVTVVAPTWRGARETVKQELSAAGARLPVSRGSRERIAGSSTMQGEVIRWCGGFGWISPDVSIDHPAAMKHHGDVFVHVSDVIGGSKFESGEKVQFIVYADKSGLGAEECRRIGGASKGFGRGNSKGGDGVDRRTSRSKAVAPLRPLASSHPARGDFIKPPSPSSSPASFPASALRALPPLRLATPVDASPLIAGRPSDSRSGNDLDVKKSDDEDADTTMKEDVVEEDLAEEDEVDVLGFVVEGEDDEDDELGFVVDADGDASITKAGCTSSASTKPSGIDSGDAVPPGFDVWALLTADDEAPESSQAHLVDASGQKRPLPGAPRACGSSA